MAAFTSSGTTTLVSTPPIITSYTAFGRVLALLYAFASVAVPRAKTRTKVRRKPVTREISVPIAIEPVDRARLVPAAAGSLARVIGPQIEHGLRDRIARRRDQPPGTASATKAACGWKIGIGWVSSPGGTP